MLIITAMSTAWIMYKGIVDDFGTAFREAIFQVVTLVTTCGFATTDYIPWGSLLLAAGVGSHDCLRLCGFYLRRLEDGTFCDPDQEPLQ